MREAVIHKAEPNRESTTPRRAATHISSRVDVRPRARPLYVHFFRFPSDDASMMPEPG
jgi:hypothetical protein